MFEFVRELGESRLVPSARNLTRFDEKTVTMLTCLYLCALRILLAEPTTQAWARRYAKKTVSWEFDTWRTSGTDLFALLHAIFSPDVDLKGPDYRATLPFSEDKVRVWLAHVGIGTETEQQTRALFARLDFDLRITDTSLRAVRRMVLDWPKLDRADEKLVMTRLLQMIRHRAPRAEILDRLEEMAAARDLELTDVCNKETGDCESAPVEPKGGLLRSLALGGGAAIAGAMTSRRLRDRRADR